MNSMLAIRAFARYAIATPSPVATDGIRGVEVDLPGAASGEQRRLREHRHHLARLLVEHVGAKAVEVRPELAHVHAEVVLRDQIDGEVVLEQIDVGVVAHLREQRPLDLAARHVGGVDDPVGRVPALAAEVERCVRCLALVIEVRAERHQLTHALRPLRHDDPHHLLIAQPGPRYERVVNVVLDGVGRVHHRRDSALRVVRVRLRRCLLGDDRDGAVLSGAEGERESGHPAADDEKVVSLCHHFFSDSLALFLRRMITSSCI